MRAIVAWCLHRVAGPELARDIEGDVAERGGRASQLAAMVMSMIVTRARETAASLWRSLPGGRRSGHDLRYSLRSLRRAPWYSLAVIAVVGLTGALATAAFAIVDGVLFKRLPIPNPESLYAAAGPGGGALSLADLEAWRRAAPNAAIALYGRDFVIGATGAPRPQPIVALRVEQSFFDVLGERPVVGGWRASDFEPGAPRTRIILSDRLWRRMFGARADIVGQTFEIAGAADSMQSPLGGFEVAGVLPRDFVFPVNRSTPDMLLPLALPAGKFNSRNDAAGRVLIRTAHAGPELAAAFNIAYGNKPLTSASSDTGSMALSLTPIAKFLSLWQRDTLASAFAACAVLMLLAVLNIGALSVLRGQQQMHELGVRRALGATRLDLFRLALFDAAPLIAAGMALALAAAPWLIHAATTRVSDGVALLKTPVVDARVLAFWLVLAILTIVAAASLRTLAVTPGSVTAATRRGQNSTSRRARFGAASIAVQVALAFVITVAGTLIAGSLWRLWQEPIGFTMDRTWLVELSHQSKTTAERRAVMLSVLDRIKQIPGVEAVASIGGAPFLTGSSRVQPFERLPEGTSKKISAAVWPIDAEYFGMLSIPLRAGRVFTAHEVATLAPAVVISESVARKFFPAGDAVGNSLARFGTPLAVIGVVGDVQTGGLGYRADGQLYEPGGSLSGQRVVLLVKGRSPIDPVLATVSSEPVGVTRAMSLVEALGRPNQDAIFRAWLFGAFAMSALVIVAVGTFGIIAMSVGRRTRELGIRSALGATRESLVGLFVREQLVTVVLGLAAGAGLSIWATRFIKAYLFKTPPVDPMLWSAAAAILLLVAGTAALVPSVRASRIDPVRALREE